MMLSDVLDYAGVVLEGCLLAFILIQGRWKQLKALSVYLTLILLADGVVRPWVLHVFGQQSVEYSYTYWLTDIALALGAFLLICAFFRRAYAGDEKRWSFLRLTLAFVFLLTLAISCETVLRNYHHLFDSHFIYNFCPDLYLACLILNTILYAQLQSRPAADHELQFLVAGLGIQFAGIAGGLAFVYLSGQKYAQSLFELLSPLCAWGMLLVWSYAVMWPPKLSARLRAMPLPVARPRMSP